MTVLSTALSHFTTLTSMTMTVLHMRSVPSLDTNPLFYQQRRNIPRLHTQHYQRRLNFASMCMIVYYSNNIHTLAFYDVRNIPTTSICYDDPLNSCICIYISTFSNVGLNLDRPT